MLPIVRPSASRYVLFLHDALPIFPRSRLDNLIPSLVDAQALVALVPATGDLQWAAAAAWDVESAAARRGQRAEEHTSELQSTRQLVCRLVHEEIRRQTRAASKASP